MKKILLLVLLSLALNCYCAKSFQFYKIDGSEIIVKEKNGLTISVFQQKYFAENKYFYNYDVSKIFYDFSSEKGILAIIFQEFANKPLYILGNSPTKKQIDEALKSFDYNKYYTSSQFAYKLKKYVNEQLLTIEDIYRTFGKASNTVNTSSLTILSYSDLQLYFTIKEGIVIDFEQHE